MNLVKSSMVISLYSKEGDAWGGAIETRSRKLKLLPHKQLSSSDQIC